MTGNTITDRNYKIEITNGLKQYINSIGTDYIVYLLPNTKDNYSITISDANNDPIDFYYPRRYDRQYFGNPLTATLQPYLLHADDATAYEIVLKYAYGGTTINNAKIEIHWREKRSMKSMISTV